MIPRLYGPRGLMLLGFAVLSGTLGYGYLTGQFSGRTLFGIASVIPLFGVLWSVLALWLLWGAFHVKQSLALGAFSGMCFIWGTGYGVTAVARLAHTGDWGLILLSVVFYSLTVACLGASRMANPAVSHLAVIRRPGLPPHAHGERGT